MWIVTSNQINLLGTWKPPSHPSLALINQKAYGRLTMGDTSSGISDTKKHSPASPAGALTSPSQAELQVRNYSADENLCLSS